MPTRFGPFDFDRQSRLLWREGTEVALPPRVLGVLEVLIDRPGQVVARQDLLDGVWKDAFVTDTSLAEAVSFLRQALGDDPQAPTYIQTVHRRGYRFLPALTETPPRGQTPAAAETGVRPQPSDFRGQTPAAAETGVRPQPSDYPLGRVKPSIGLELLPWSVAILCAALAMSAVWRFASLPAPEVPPVVRFDVRPVDGSSFDRSAPPLAVSADGRVLAWSACDATSGACALYVRPVDRLDPARLAGTEGAASPFFSPDGRWIGFFADGKLKKIAASGGSPSIVADAPAPGGAAWGPGGRIAFAGLPAGGLSLVSDQGGAVTALTTPQAERGEVRHLSPSWLPGGTAILFTSAISPVAGAPGNLAVVPLGSKSPRILRRGATRAASGPGYLLISSGTDLQAATFDERTLTLTGAAESVLAAVTGGEGVAQVVVSAGGTLAAIRTPRAERAVWTDRAAADAGPVGRLAAIAVSPDSRRAAGVIADSNNSDIWMAELATGALTRVTYGGINVSPAWSADGERIFFATRTSGAFGIASRTVTDRANAQAIAQTDTHLFPASAAADGRLAVTTTLPGGRTAVGIIAPGGSAPQVFNDGPFDEAAPAFSPDGRWLALESDESGRTEIVLRNLADGRRVAVSTDGGSRPRWSADGRAVYFDAGRRLMRAAIDASREPHVEKADVFFNRAGARVLAVTPSGRVLIEEDPSPGGDAALVVLQWLRELRQRLPLPVTAPR
jgi:DNA-binding winged helix-turn-helix (wHTH) protein/Tol biopolymer transport system component